MNRFLPLLCALPLIILLPFSVARAQVAPGQPCLHIGETKISDDYHHIVACLSTKMDGAGNPITPSDPNDCAGGTTCFWISQTGATPGIVKAFNAASCPPGWKAADYLNGRIIVGTGDSGTLGSSSHGFGSGGGHEDHQVQPRELPTDPTLSDAITTTPHGPVVDHVTQGTNSSFPMPTCKANNKSFYRAVLNNSGSQFNVSLMNPYYVLTYCEKK